MLCEYYSPGYKPNKRNIGGESMLFDIPKNKIDEWKWNKPRMNVLIEFIKKYEPHLEEGKQIVFSLSELMKDCGYPPERYIRHNSFVNIIKSDFTLLEPFKLNGGRLIIGFHGYEGGVRKGYCQYMKQEILKLTTEADVRDDNKNYAEGEN